MIDLLTYFFTVPIARVGYSHAGGEELDQSDVNC